MDKKRLVLENQTMMERWSSLNPRLVWDSVNKRLWWQLELRAEGDNRLPIRIEYPQAYPACPPNLVVATKLPSGTPHMLSGNRMCWYYPREDKRSRNMWSPSKDTAAVCVGVAQRWFYAFLVWISTGHWPVPDALDD